MFVKYWQIKVIKISGSQSSINLFLKKNKAQDINLEKLKLEIHETIKKDEKLKTIVEPLKKEDVFNKAYLDEKLF